MAAEQALNPYRAPKLAYAPLEVPGQTPEQARSRWALFWSALAAVVLGIYATLFLLSFAVMALLIAD